MNESRSPDELFLAVVGAILVIVLAARAVAWLFRRIGLPTVLGEVVAGIALGPSLLGLVNDGRLFDSLFPADIQPLLRVIAQLGLAFFMFLVGLQLDHRLLRRQGRAAVAVSLASIGVPFVLGVTLGLAIHPGEGNKPWFSSATMGSPRWPFALFLGLSIAGSAFAILARVLSERGIFRTRVGSLLMGSAAVDDIAIWSIAAVVLSVAGSDAGGHPARTLGALVAFTAGLFLVVRPILARTVGPAFARAGERRTDLVAILLLLLLAAALFTTWIGVQALLGAFLFGAAVPRDPEGRMVEALTDRVESISVLLLLPVFFAVTGFAVDLTEVDGKALALFGLVAGIAMGGKFLGAAATARLFGFRGRRAAAVGVLMNTRGLTELAIVSLGLSVGALTTETYTALVLTAVVSTVLASRAVDLVYPRRLVEADIAEAEAARLRLVSGSYRVVVVIDDAERGGALVETAVTLARSEPNAEVVLLSFASMRRPTELGFAVAEEFVEQAARIEELERLAAPFREEGVRVAATALLSRNPGEELRLHLERVSPDALVLGATDDELLPVALGQPDTDVVVLVARGPLHGELGLVDAGDVEGAAEIAGRLAIGGDRQIRLVAGERPSRTARALSRAFADGGLAVPEGTGESAATVALVPLGDDWEAVPPFGTAANRFAATSSGAVLVVRPRPAGAERPAGMAAVRELIETARARAGS